MEATEASLESKRVEARIWNPGSPEPEGGLGKWTQQVSRSQSDFQLQVTVMDGQADKCKGLWGLHTSREWTS